MLNRSILRRFYSANKGSLTSSLPNQPSGGHSTGMSRKLDHHHKWLKSQNTVFKPLLVAGPICSGKVSDSCFKVIIADHLDRLPQA